MAFLSFVHVRGGKPETLSRPGAALWRTQLTFLYTFIGISGSKERVDEGEEMGVFDTWGGHAALAPRAQLVLEHMWVQRDAVSVTLPFRGGLQMK